MEHIVYKVFLELIKWYNEKCYSFPKVIRAAKSDSRLANNNLPLDIQKLRCRACYEALRFAPQIEAMGKVILKSKCLS